MYSIISRHFIQTICHSIIFLIHDLMIPLFLSQIILQFFTNMIDLKYHKWNGLFILCCLFPFIYMSGYLLSFYISDKNYAYIFVNYGYNYLAIAINLYYYKNINFLLMPIYIYLFFSNLFVLYYLFMNLMIPKYLDLFIVLYPLPFINLLNIYSLFKYDIKKIHIMNAYLFLYLGLLGTFFSISQDSYWIFLKKPNLFIRFLILNIPLVFVLSRFRILI
jgi:hypothetical protein